VPTACRTQRSVSNDNNMEADTFSERIENVRRQESYHIQNDRTEDDEASAIICEQLRIQHQVSWRDFVQ